MVVVQVVILVALGCGGGADKEPAREEPTRAECATKECAENVSKKMDDWSKSQGEAGERAARAMSEADKRKGMVIAEAMGKCMMKAMAAEPPGR